jgi:plastocyanin
MNRLDVWGVMVCGVLLWSALLPAPRVSAQRAPATHEIFMSAVELKGATTTEKLSPPAVNPVELSKGYGFKAPGEADPGAPERWEVSSYLLTPGFATVQQGDTVRLTAFVVNGDQHEVVVLGPDGQVVVPTATWQRGREYRLSFVAAQAGAYHLRCLTHAPTMTATILALPR